jgi:uncharacterized SAM-binding protein YcdF (DUF218 family)
MLSRRATRPKSTREPSPYDRSVIRRLLCILAAASVVLLAAVGVSGQVLLRNAPDDELRAADAVVVLGGEHDGREEYGIAVARQIRARAVLLSDPYRSDDRVMTPLCGKRINGIEVLCRRPDPLTTLGEAQMARAQSLERGWNRIVVVTWRFHLLRSRLIFSRCYSDEPGRVIMRAVPRSYEFSFAMWTYVYLYQYAGVVNLALRNSC